MESQSLAICMIFPASLFYFPHLHQLFAKPFRKWRTTRKPNAHETIVWEALKNETPNIKIVLDATIRQPL